ncbi:hypothetical protein AB4J97_12900 [Serratia fonticola]|uniref:hypothetical protein n=1 Tax=Serratia fonticola TaxID=47917 RepID=UPI0034C5F302
MPRQMAAPAAPSALDAHFELLSEENQAIPRPQAVSFHLAHFSPPQRVMSC